MTKNTRIVSVAGIFAAVVIVLVLIYVHQRAPKTIQCDDGPRLTINVDDFNNKYWAYSYQFEVNLIDRLKVSAKIQPVQLQKLSEALQQTAEFRKYLVAGYNSCALPKHRFEEYGIRFQTLDEISRELDPLLSREKLSDAEAEQLRKLIAEYIKESRIVSTK